MNPNVNDMILFHDLFTGTYEIRIDPASAQQMIADYRESIERESAAEIATLKAQRDELLAERNRLETKSSGGANTLAELMSLLEIARDNKTGISLDWVETGIALRNLSEPAQDDVKPEVGDIVAWDKEGLNVEAYKHPRREIVRRPVVLMLAAEVKRRIEEAKE